MKLRRKPMIDNENNAVHRMYLPYRTIFRLSRTGKDASFHKLRRCSGVSELCTHKIRPFRRYICSKGQSEVKCCQHGILRRAEARRFTPCANSGLHSRNRPARQKKHTLERPLRVMATLCDATPGRGRRNVAHRPPCRPQHTKPK